MRPGAHELAMELGARTRFSFSQIAELIEAFPDASLAELEVEVERCSRARIELSRVIQSGMHSDEERMGLSGSLLIEAMEREQAELEAGVTGSRKERRAEKARIRRAVRALKRKNVSRETQGRGGVDP